MAFRFESVTQRAGPLSRNGLGGVALNITTRFSSAVVWAATVWHAFRFRFYPIVARAEPKGGLSPGIEHGQ